MYQDGGRGVASGVIRDDFKEEYRREEAIRGPRINPDKMPSSVEFLFVLNFSNLQKLYK